jgi:hypothetical protein
MICKIVNDDPLHPASPFAQCHRTKGNPSHQPADSASVVAIIPSVLTAIAAVITDVPTAIPTILTDIPAHL